MQHPSFALSHVRPLALLGTELAALLAAHADEGNEDTLIGNGKIARTEYDMLSNQRRDIMSWIGLVKIWVDRHHVGDTEIRLINARFDQYEKTMIELKTTAHDKYNNLLNDEAHKIAYAKLDAYDKHAEDEHYAKRFEFIDSSENYCLEMRAKLQKIFAEQKELKVTFTQDPTWPLLPPWGEFDDYDPTQDKAKTVPLNYEDEPPPEIVETTPKKKVNKLVRRQKSDSDNTDDEDEADAPAPQTQPKAQHAPLPVDTGAPPPPPPPGGAPKAPHAPNAPPPGAPKAQHAPPAPPPQAPVQIVPEEQEPEPETEPELPDKVRQSVEEFKNSVTTRPQEDEPEEPEEMGNVGMSFVLNQRALTDTFETFRDTNAPPVVGSLKTAEAPVDVARATFAQCAKFFVEIMSKKPDAADRKHDEAKAEMQATYIETIESTNTGACFRGLYNDKTHTMAPFDSEHRHILSAQAIFAPFHLETPAAAAAPVEAPKERIEVDNAKKKVELDKISDLSPRADGEEKNSEVDVELKKARVALRRKTELDKMRAAEVEIELEKKRAADIDLAQKKAHVKQQVRALLAAACPPSPAPPWPTRTMFSCDPNLKHVLCARAARIARLADTHPLLAALRAEIELPPARRALSLK